MAHNGIEWLPDLVIFENYSGDWTKYLEGVYRCFQQDFVYHKPKFRGIRIGLRKHPITDNKEFTFWHLISEGNVEAERIPDFRRCERIRWLRPMIENSNDQEIKVWENERKGDRRILLLLDRLNYIIILARRKGQNSREYIIPLTAYPVEQEHRKRKLLDEYNDYKKQMSLIT